MKFLTLFNPRFWRYLVSDFRQNRQRKNSLAKYKDQVKLGADAEIAGTCSFGREVIVGDRVRLTDTAVGDYSYFSGDSEIRNATF